MCYTLQLSLIYYQIRRAFCTLVPSLCSCISVHVIEHFNYSTSSAGAREAAFRNIKSIAECLADELINAAKVSVSVTSVLLPYLVLQLLGVGKVVC